MNYENAVGSMVKVPWYGTCTVVPQVYLPINSTPLRARETSVDRHATEQVYYPSIITQEATLTRVGVVRATGLRADRRLRVVEVVVVDVEAVVQRTRLGRRRRPVAAPDFEPREVGRRRAVD